MSFHRLLLHSQLHGELQPGRRQAVDIGAAQADARWQDARPTQPQRLHDQVAQPRGEFEWLFGLGLEHVSHDVRRD